jgi:hypothetical protein
MFQSGDLVTCIKEFNSCGQIFPVGTVFKISSFIKGEFQPFGTIFWLPNDHFEKLIKESECKSQSATASFVPRFKKDDKFRRSKEYCDRNWYSDSMHKEVLVAKHDSYIESDKEFVYDKTNGFRWLVEDVEAVTFEPTFKKGDIVYRTKEYCKKIGLRDYYLTEPITLECDSYIDTDGIEKIWSKETAAHPINMFTKDKPVPPFVPKIKKGDKIRRTEKQQKELKNNSNAKEILIAKEDSKLNDTKIEIVETTKYPKYYWRVDDQVELVPFEPTYKKDDILRFGDFVYIVTKDSEMRDNIEYVTLQFPLDKPWENRVNNLAVHTLYRPVA